MKRNDITVGMRVAVYAPSIRRVRGRLRGEDVVATDWTVWGHPTRRVNDRDVLYGTVTALDQPRLFHGSGYGVRESRDGIVVRLDEPFRVNRFNRATDELEGVTEVEAITVTSRHILRTEAEERERRGRFARHIEAGDQRALDAEALIVPKIEEAEDILDRMRLRVGVRKGTTRLSAAHGHRSAVTSATITLTVDQFLALARQDAGVLAANIEDERLGEEALANGIIG